MIKDFKDYFKLDGKVAVVTGARRGMGRTHCFALADSGAKVVVSDIKLAECELVVEEIRERGGDACAIECDVSKKEEVDKLIKETKETYGRIDILVNNAGIVDFKNFFDLQEEDWERILNVNLKGCFFCSQAVAEVMKESGGGSIINIGSIAMGQNGIGFPNTVPYVASKGGVAGITEAMAVDLADYNIRVNLIAPGVIETPMIDNIMENDEMVKQIISRLPLKRIGKPEEISSVVLFLASDASSYMTGSVINVDGGWLTT
jgi:NAD(P)-dependent dehydrogenase (short-subunit alcohol dehydrogenase family)